MPDLPYPLRKEQHTANGTIGSHSISFIPSGIRIESIDFLRGLVMVIMALDHVRDYFHFDAFLFSPTDLSKTTPALFITRWVTHLCAPAFIFLAGLAVYISSQKKSKTEMSKFLITRGLWLIFLQFTIIRFAWNFDPAFHFNSSTIISTIGICMIFLAAIIHLPFKIIFAGSLLMIVGHNMLDAVKFSDGSAADLIWSLFHANKSFNLGDGYSFNVVYPFVPWIAVMALGYCLGSLYSKFYSIEKRKKILFLLGMASLSFFFLLRSLNVYGDPQPWTIQKNISYTIISFFNVAKYPPSLLYLCSTLGITLLLLSALEGKTFKRSNPFVIFGRTPMFYYVLHVYVIHVLASIVILSGGYPLQAIVLPKFNGGPDSAPLLQGKYGFNLGIVYLVWIFVVLLLYPVCRWFNEVKIRNKKKWWVSYV